jgi:prepilin-type N-terminal cleavage/methylation domain-containing protein
MKPTCQCVSHALLKSRLLTSPCSQRGLTLIEILLVMAIFSIGILAIMTLQITAINSNAKARRIMRGSTILADQFEKLISAGDASPGLTPGESTSHADNGLVFERTITTTRIPNIKKIDLTITWDVDAGKSCQLTYYKRSPG